MNKIKNIIFMGTPNFAVPSLVELIQKNYKPSLIITKSDKKRGRGRKISYSPVKKIGLKYDIPIHQPKNPNNKKTIKEIKDLKPDLIIVVAYGKFICNEILDIPKYKCINLHPSLLPKYRGPSPINWALFNGDEVTGNSIIYITQKMDAGDIIYQSEMPIHPDDNYGTLKEKLSKKSGSDILKGISLLEKDEINPKPQDEKKATFSKLITKYIRRINWQNSAENINNKIRGLAPKPAAFSVLNKKTMKILEAEPWEENQNNKCGQIFSIVKGKGILVGTETKPLLVKKIKPAGKQTMSAFSYSLGHKIKNKFFSDVE
ncbi:MAG: methionyl-tRNA formyltransferase [Candidatus Cloacimonetes bacterium]|nr:methionyl-tRNA formyltransferase [Candidatus Cloacimonadota bacterium]MBS3766507.1 methionyl-tRNA formyltransferase [Candidatus Cloacimonadota bacterium]